MVGTAPWPSLSFTMPGSIGFPSKGGVEFPSDGTPGSIGDPEGVNRTGIDSNEGRNGGDGSIAT